MPRRSTSVESFRPLKPTEFHILLVLSAGDLHGYGMVEAVRQQTEGEVTLELGSLYRIIARMSAEGLIAEAPSRPGDDSRRRSYRLTSLGRDVATRETQRAARVLRLAEARRLLGREAPR